MTALVVYESLFGNTKGVAEAVAAGLGEHGEVRCLEVSEHLVLAPDVDLLVVGGPTHAFGLSRPTTRADAQQQAGPGMPMQVQTGLREWLEQLPRPGRAVSFAAFDTRVDRPRLPGSAARKATRMLRDKGLRQCADPQSFWVHGVPGPLLAGEADRAVAWGRSLGARARAGHVGAA